MKRLCPIVTAPLTTAEFGDSLTALGAPSRFIVAVSGGPDSMALLRLAGEYAAANKAAILAVTVDHGLRATARAEADQVGAYCRAAGIAHAIVEWTGEKPATGIQAAARAARYRLLAECADAEGGAAILTGHTADDQAETVFMRLSRGAGPAGLAGMAGETLVAAGAGKPVRVLRPLLDSPRARLVATLEALGQPFIDDPSNDDPAFERVRVRALLAALEEQGLLGRAALCRTAARMRAAARRLEATDIHAFEAAGGVFHAGWIALARWRDAPASLIARIVRAVGTGDHPPGEDEAEAARQTATAGGAATLGGALLKIHRGRLCATREPAALFGRAGVRPMAPVSLAPGAAMVWDRRFILVNEGAEAVRVGPAGDGESEADDEAAPLEARRTLPAALAVGLAAAARLRIEPLLEERFYGRVMRFC